MAICSSAAVTSMDVPQTQNTAPVLEFRCLFTQDLRRKQKRWQDGRLKFHTFNKRVMVYDERSNLVGDTHWREDTEFNEGEELELERGGIMVEVGEYIGKRDQDLFELVDKRVKEREERAAAKGAASTPARPQASLARTTQGTPGPLQHKPLNSMLGITGHYGRAVISNTSPFEEKQRLVNSNQDGAENGRPAKRRKQNEVAPSKSGYAQNLMGATLNLGSSMPPSTAKIRYEPVKIRPVVPTQTVDLTGEEDDDEGNPRSKPVVRETPIVGSGNIRGQGQRRLKRSPPAKSGYASNLTGASLSLSRPEDLPSKRVTKIPPASKPARRMVQEDDESSLESEEDSFVDIDSVTAVVLPEGPPRKDVESSKRTPMSDLYSSSPTLAQENNSLRDPSELSTNKKFKPAKEVPPFEEISSSFSMVDEPTPIPKPSRVVQKARIQTSSAAIPTPDQPVSGLRIKSRPPRKMMMLMDRPSSRSSVRTDSNITSLQKSKTIQNANVASIGPVLSQATLNLNSFCQRQEEIIQARLNSKRPSSGLDDLSSSPEGDRPEDRGIDHQTIDLLLSRKGPPVQKNLTVERDRANSRTEAVATNNCGLTTDSNDRNILKSPTSEIPPRTPKYLETLPREGQNCNSKNQNPLPEVHVNGKREVSTAPGSSLLSEKTIPTSTVDTVDGISGEFFTAPQLQSATDRGNPAQSRVTDASGLTSEFVTAPLPPSEWEQAFAQSLLFHSSTALAKPPANLSSAVQSATDHFRAIIKSSANSTIPLGDVSSAPQIDHVEDLPAVETCHIQKASCEDAAVKAAPESSPVEGAPNVWPESFENAPGLETAKCLDQSFGNAVASATIANSGKADPPKTRLVNPATRGKSLHTIAANMTDSLAMAPVFSLMPPPPPPPRTTVRPQRVVERNTVAEQRATSDGYVGSRASTGPWSQESFDLFGSWLPPGIGVATTSASK